jgi:putative membrane protein
MSLPAALRVLLAIAVVASLWSVSGARQLDVWAFELVPGILGVVGLAVIARWFQFSGLTYYVIALSFVFIATGARYTYAEMPLFNWLKDAVHLSRNHFDRVGHYLQGLTVGLMTREVLYRTTNVNRRWWLPILAISFALAFSALYELVEWWIVLAFYPESGASWLGLQGDEWDAQWDMTMALLGAVTSCIALAAWHNRSLNQLNSSLP